MRAPALVVKTRRFVQEALRRSSVVLAARSVVGNLSREGARLCRDLEKGKRRSALFDQPTLGLALTVAAWLLLCTSHQKYFNLVPGNLSSHVTGRDSNMEHIVHVSGGGSFFLYGMERD